MILEDIEVWTEMNSKPFLIHTRLCSSLYKVDLLSKDIEKLQHLGKTEAVTVLGFLQVIS